MGHANLKAVILAAGKGKRLQPLTPGVPKPLLPVANKPILHHAIDALWAEGIVEIGLVVREGVAEIKRALDHYAQAGVHLTYIPQETPCGTGQAVEEALPFVGDDPYVLYFGDNLIGDTLHGLIERYHCERPQVVLGVKQVPNAKDYGIVEMAEGRVIRVLEKPPVPPTDLALTGISVIDGGLSYAFTHLPFSTRGEKEFPDGIARIIERGGGVLVHEFKDWWLDIGSPDRLLEANRRLLDRMTTMIAPDAKLVDTEIVGPVSIGSGAVVTGGVIGPHVSLGPGAVLEHVTIADSIVMQGGALANVGHPITSSIVGEHAQIRGGGMSHRFLVGNASRVELT